MNKNLVTVVIFLSVLCTVFADGRVLTNAHGRVYTNALVPRSDWRSRSIQNGVSYRLDKHVIEQLQAVAERPVITSRTFVGDTVIEHWSSGSRSWATTNSVTPVIGEKLQSTFTERIEKLEKAKAAWAANWTNENRRAEIAEKLAARREAVIRSELDRLYEDRAELEEKAADMKYLLLKPWIELKLKAVELRIKILEEQLEK